ncbi:hypothetical protein LINGRAHAP2_LOCUS36901 [Linum grandiflorum]
MTTSRSKKALALLKHIISSLVSSAVRAKSAVARNKTSQVVKARVAMTSLVMGRKKKMLQLQLASVCDKIINTALGGSSRTHSVINFNNEQDDHRAIVVYNPNLNSARGCCCCCCTNVDDDTGYSDHSYEAAAVQPSLIIDDDRLIINPNEINEDKDPCLYVVDVHDHNSCTSTDRDQMLDNYGEEDDIDEVADMFIMRFHKQMRLQKLESFKRYQEEMLQRSL